MSDLIGLKTVRRRLLSLLVMVAVFFALAWPTRASDEAELVAVGTRGAIGCAANPKRVKRLVIDEPGVYEKLSGGRRMGRQHAGQN